MLSIPAVIGAIVTGLFVEALGLLLWLMSLS